MEVISDFCALVLGRSLALPAWTCGLRKAEWPPTVQVVSRLQVHVCTLCMSVDLPLKVAAPFHCPAKDDWALRENPYASQ